jgi:hypothetical protein
MMICVFPRWKTITQKIVFVLVFKARTEAENNLQYTYANKSTAYEFTLKFQNLPKKHALAK